MTYKNLNDAQLQVVENDIQAILHIADNASDAKREQDEIPAIKDEIRKVIKATNKKILEIGAEASKALEGIKEKHAPVMLDILMRERFSSSAQETSEHQLTDFVEELTEDEEKVYDTLTNHRGFQENTLQFIAMLVQSLVRDRLISVAELHKQFGDRWRPKMTYLKEDFRVAGYRIDSSKQEDNRTIVGYKLIRY